VSGTWLQILNSLSFAALLFIVASGFTLIFGLLRVVNLAHGALYLMGGYIGMTAAVATGSFALGAIAAAVAIAFAGLVLDRGLLNFVKNQELKQVLLTLGVALVLDDLALVLWGGDTRTIPIPQFLQGAAQFGEIFYPKYRLMVLASGVIIFLLLGLLYNRTRLGAMIRAGVDDAEMVQAIGGVLGGAFLTLYPSADSEILVYSLAIVIIGGRGSLAGAAIGSLLVGFLATFGQIWFPELAYFVIFGPMA
jgi:branched-chain amino acid transport system permease protein